MVSTALGLAGVAGWPPDCLETQAMAAAANPAEARCFLPPWSLSLDAAMAPFTAAAALQLLCLFCLGTGAAVWSSDGGEDTFV